MNILARLATKKLKQFDSPSMQEVDVEPPVLVLVVVVAPPVAEARPPVGDDEAVAPPDVDTALPMEDDEAVAPPAAVAVVPTEVAEPDADVCPPDGDVVAPTDVSELDVDVRPPDSVASVEALPPVDAAASLELELPAPQAKVRKPSAKGNTVNWQVEVFIMDIRSSG